MNLITFLGGAFVTYIYPKYVDFVLFRIKGWILIVCDLLFHVLPFYVAVRNKYYRTFTIQDMYLTIIILCLYFMFNDPFKIYKLEDKKNELLNKLRERYTYDDQNEQLY
jgi:hypothetical protein